MSGPTGRLHSKYHMSHMAVLSCMFKRCNLHTGWTWTRAALRALMHQMLNCFYNPASTLWFAGTGTKLSLTPDTAFQLELLWCRVFHINYTTDHIWDSLRTEVRGTDTKYLFFWSNKTVWGPVQWRGMLLPLATSANIILHADPSFQKLQAECDRGWKTSCFTLVWPSSLSVRPFGESSWKQSLK